MVGTKIKVQSTYRNSDDNATLVEKLSACDSKGPLSVHIAKLIYNEHNASFYALGRIMSGTLKKGDQVKVMGEGFTLEEEEDVVVKEVQRLWLL